MATMADALRAAGVNSERFEPRRDYSERFEPHAPKPRQRSPRADTEMREVRVYEKRSRRVADYLPAPTPVQNVLKAPEPAPRWPDLDEMQRQLSEMHSALTSAYPKIWGRHAGSAYIYQVWRRCGTGAWSSMVKTSDREKALAVYRGCEGMERYIDMRNALTMELVGEMGRAPQEVLDTLAQVLDEIEVCDPFMTQRVAVDAWREGSQRRLHQDRNRLELLHHQASSLMAMCYLPAETVMI